MTQPRQVSWLAVITALVAFALAPGRATAQSGTDTDDGFLSTNSTTQALNLNGQGISLIVAGSSATVGPLHVGTTTTYLKFQLASSLPPSAAAANVAKATLKLYISPGIVPAGEINIYPITSAWTESTLNPSAPPTLAASPLASNIPVGKANSFIVVDVTQLVQEWLEGSADGGIDNDGIALEAATSTSYVVFDSKEDIITSHEPRLEIVLTDAGPQGPPGAAGAAGTPGAAGAPGVAATIQIGTVTTGPASVTNAGTLNAAILNFSVPQGPAGINNRGTWTNSTQYNQNDAVSDANSFWLALLVNKGSEPNINNPNWQLLAAGINNRGAWIASTGYNVNDAVTDAGSYWLALAPTSASSATPSTSCEPSQPGCSSDWQQLAAQGSPGAAGQQGQSVTTSPEPAGTNCAFGGSKFTAANGTTYACNGATGSTGPTGPAGPAGSGSGGFNGIQEFTQSGTFTVPAGITHIFAEMWGGGGGGGAGGASISVTVSGGQVSCNGSPGSGGGAGGYARGVATVTPGAVYSITVGAAGPGGAAPGSEATSTGGGGNGGDSQVTDSSGTVLIKAGGGQGGSPGNPGAPLYDATGTVVLGCVTGQNSGFVGLPGAGGQGGTGPGVIGRNGANGSSPPSSVENGSQTTTPPLVGSIPVGFDSTGGAGGAMGIVNCEGSCSQGGNGGAGGQGYILIMW